MFQVGDRVRFVPEEGAAWRAEKGAVGTVGSRGVYTERWGGPYVDIVWDRDHRSGSQCDGGYIPSTFELLFKVGDYVKVVNDAADLEGSHLGQTGKVVLHDGSKEGFWPYRVEFADGEDEIYNAADLEHSTAEEFEPKVEVVTVALEDEYIEGYLVVDEDNDVLTVWDDYETAYNEAKQASQDLAEPIFVYKLVTAFEPGMNRIYNLV